MSKQLQEFIDAVADYLTSDVGTKSIMLEIGKPDAKKWAAAYQASGCRGHATKQECAEAIRKMIE